MTGKGIIALSLLIAFLYARSDSADGGSFIQATDSDLGLLIKKRITEWEISSQKVVGGEPIYAAVLVEGFYRGKNYQPSWRKDGRLIQAETLIKAIEEVYGDGLTPDYYHLGVMKSLVREVKNGSLVDPARFGRPRHTPHGCIPYTRLSPVGRVCEPRDYENGMVCKT